jgi:hypothetical protein
VTGLQVKPAEQLFIQPIRIETALPGADSPDNRR